MFFVFNVNVHVICVREVHKSLTVILFDFAQFFRLFISVISSFIGQIKKVSANAACSIQAPKKIRIESPTYQTNYQ